MASIIGWLGTLASLRIAKVKSLPTRAHEEYVDRVQKGLVPMPELWTWHTKGTRHGQADVVWKAGGFLLALRPL
jgi:hypothetical protein